MSPKPSIKNNGRNKGKTDEKVVTDLNVICHEMKKKESDEPLYLLRL